MASSLAALPVATHDACRQRRTTTRVKSSVWPGWANVNDASARKPSPASGYFTRWGVDRHRSAPAHEPVTGSLAAIVAPSATLTSVSQFGRPLLRSSAKGRLRANGAPQSQQHASQHEQTRARRHVSQHEMWCAHPGGTRAAPRRGGGPDLTKRSARVLKFQLAKEDDHG
jgi:hypothetical protein